MGNIHCDKSFYIRSFSVPYFPVLGLNMERYCVSLRIQSKCGKMRTRKTTNTETFLRSHSLLAMECSLLAAKLFKKSTYPHFTAYMSFHIIGYPSTATDCIPCLWFNLSSTTYGPISIKNFVPLWAYATAAHVSVNSLVRIFSTTILISLIN